MVLPIENRPWQAAPYRAGHRPTSKKKHRPAGAVDGPRRGPDEGATFFRARVDKEPDAGIGRPEQAGPADQPAGAMSQEWEPFPHFGCCNVMVMNHPKNPEEKASRQEGKGA